MASNFFDRRLDLAEIVCYNIDTPFRYLLGLLQVDTLHGMVVQTWLVKIIAIGLSVGHPTIAVFRKNWTTVDHQPDSLLLHFPNLQPIFVKVQVAGMSRFTPRFSHVRVPSTGLQHSHGEGVRYSAEMSRTNIGRSMGIGFS
jgi:hypothetical protein